MEAERVVGKLLIVDDSSTIRKVIHARLSEAGYRVEQACSGEEAFERCLRERFDLVVSDVTMGALSGMQLCRLLRADSVTSLMPVILLTARNDPRSRFWGRHAGATAYLTKDRLNDDLLPMVRGILAEIPEDKRVSLLPTRRAADPLQRLSGLLDDLLFKAVIASDVRRVASEAKDRRAFSRAVLELASDVADYAYLVFRLDSPAGSTYALHARDPFPGSPTAQSLAALELPRECDLDVTREEREPAHSTPDEPVEVFAGRGRHFMVSTGGEPLGALISYSGKKRKAARDIETLQNLATEIGLAAKNVFLVEETHRLAFTDQLTGLKNRHHAATFLEDEVERAGRYRTPLSIILGDVDRFKSVNDTYGHNIGDEVLKVVACALGQVVRKIDLVARWGGEEFLVALPATGESGARIVAERLRRAVENAPAVEGGPEKATISLGVASYRGETMYSDFVQRADEALYQAKKRGRNRAEVAA